MSEPIFSACTPLLSSHLYAGPSCKEEVACQTVSKKEDSPDLSHKEKLAYLLEKINKISLHETIKNWEKGKYRIRVIIPFDIPFHTSRRNLSKLLYSTLQLALG